MALIEVNKDNFAKEVLEKKGKILADFNANWCGPCKMLKPILEEISASNDSVEIVSINIDESEELAEKYNIFSIPCLILFENGKEIKRNVGLASKSEIEKIIGEE